VSTNEMNALNLWNQSLTETRQLSEVDDLTIDQRLKVAEITALLAIGRELSLIQNQGINPEWIQRTFDRLN
jgi:hypothetical protein